METATAAEGNGTSTSTEYDYNSWTPCQKASARALGAGLLPPLYALVFAVGVLGNALVLLVLLSRRRRGVSVSGVYLLNLAASDLLSLLTLPFWAHYKLYDDWAFGSGLCRLLSGLYYLGLYSEIFFIVLLTVDRYLAIVHAVLALRARTVACTRLASGLAWALALLASLPGFLFSRSQWEFTHRSCGLHFPLESQRQWARFQALTLNVLGLVLPLLVMAVCYTGIVSILLSRPNAQKARAVRLIVAVMLIFFLFWTPYNLAVLVSVYQESLFTDPCAQSRQLDVALQVTEVIAYTHCCVNPVIYAFVGERFRKSLRQLFHRHVAMRLPFLSVDRPERASSTALSTGEHELSAVF